MQERKYAGPGHFTAFAIIPSRLGTRCGWRESVFERVSALFAQGTSLTLSCSINDSFRACQLMPAQKFLNTFPAHKSGLRVRTRRLQVKPIVLAGKDRPRHHDLGNKHEQHDPAQRKEFHPISQPVQCAVNPKNEQ